MVAVGMVTRLSVKANVNSDFGKALYERYTVRGFDFRQTEWRRVNVTHCDGRLPSCRRHCPHEIAVTLARRAQADGPPGHTGPARRPDTDVPGPPDKYVAPMWTKVRIDTYTDRHSRLGPHKENRPRGVLKKPGHHGSDRPTDQANKGARDRPAGPVKRMTSLVTA